LFVCFFETESYCVAQAELEVISLCNAGITAHTTFLDWYLFFLFLKSQVKKNSKMTTNLNLTNFTAAVIKHDLKMPSVMVHAYNPSTGLR
jgi:hypothetical protein